MPLTDKERLEINRLRAKEHRLQKKQRNENMKQQIVDLIMQNNRLRAQVNLQQDELRRLREVSLGARQQMFSNQAHGANINKTYNGTCSQQLSASSSSSSPIFTLNQPHNSFEADNSRKRKFTVSIW